MQHSPPRLILPACPTTASQTEEPRWLLVHHDPIPPLIAVYYLLSSRATRRLRVVLY